MERDNLVNPSCSWLLAPVTCCLLLTACCFPQVRPAEGGTNPSKHGLHMFLNHFSCSVLVSWFSNVCVCVCVCVHCLYCTVLYTARVCVSACVLAAARWLRILCVCVCVCAYVCVCVLRVCVCVCYECVCVCYEESSGPRPVLRRAIRRAFVRCWRVRIVCVWGGRCDLMHRICGWPGGRVPPGD